MASEQLSLSLSPAVSRSRRKRGYVPKTSVLAYEATDVKGRARNVLRWLRACEEAPTSAELAEFAALNCAAYDDVMSAHTFNDLLLYTRRGLSDLKASGAVQYDGMKKCSVCSRVCQTWRTVGR